MATVSREQLKVWFKRGMYPLESQFAAWIDSFFHKEDKLPMSSIDNLTETLNKKAENTVVDAKQDKTDDRLQTENKTVVGAINEVNDLLGPYDAQSTPYTSETASDEGVENVEEALDELFIAKAEAVTTEDINNLNWD